MAKSAAAAAAPATNNSSNSMITNAIESVIGAIIYSSFIVAGAIVFVGTRVENFIGLQDAEDEWTIVK
ncbi:hypothetical protein B9Z55_005103 [Caenorhabditis nigoni]|uniref:Uncharacterized protein n=1 Tax=Caenorhabditis nigoni TaxID=1611254 RepID=A0A2G5UZD4_9PELO|nr:hypothetical protein B9Z55_005103 [Caenorhabditis nigoni]